MQQIHVRRYHQAPVAGFSGHVEPDDRSWVLFIDDAGEASLWRRVEVRGEDGKTTHVYADAEAVTATMAVEDGEPAPVPAHHLPPNDAGWYGLDYAVAPVGHAPAFPERAASPSIDDATAAPEEGYYAHLKQRAVCAWGPTPEEATRRLMGYVAALAAAGCLDHTGAPSAAHNPRRYRIVFPESRPVGTARDLDRVPPSPVRPLAPGVAA